MRVVSKYEVACPTCGVSFPPGQKRCVHCGGRTSKSVVEVPDVPPELSAGMGMTASEPEPEPLILGDGREIVFLPDDGDGPVEGSGGGVLKRLGGLTWFILFIVLTAFRMCSDGGE